jgi:simple sugar transport system permease protein
MLHAVLSIRCRANQNITGLALNILTLGLTSFLFLKVFGQSTVLPTCPLSPKYAVPLLSKIPLIGPALFSQSGFEYILYVAVAAAWVIFYRTEWGVTLTAVGEHPRAADTAGINVLKIRYLACLVNGGRYGVYHDLESWRRYMSAAGFAELTHYYRPPGLPREQQPWLASVWRKLPAP